MCGFFGGLSSWPAGSIGWLKPSISTSDWTHVCSPLLPFPLLFLNSFFFLKSGLCPRGVVTPLPILNKSLNWFFFWSFSTLCWKFLFLSLQGGGKKKLLWSWEGFFQACGKNGCGNRERMQRLGRALPAHHERHEGKKKRTYKSFHYMSLHLFFKSSCFFPFIFCILIPIYWVTCNIRLQKSYLLHIK